MNEMQWHERANKLIQHGSKEETTFSQYFSPIDKCIILETNEYHCIFCNVSKTYERDRVCRNCIVKNCKSKYDLIKSGVKKEVFNHILENFNDKVYFRGLLFYIGEGDLEKGKSVYQTGVDRRIRKSKRKFQKLQQNRIHWIRYLSDELVANESFTQEECEQIMTKHNNDYRLAKANILNAYEKIFGLENTISSFETEFGTWKKSIRKAKKRNQIISNKLIEHANNIKNNKITNVDKAIAVVRVAYIIELYTEESDEEINDESSQESSDEVEEYDLKTALDDELQIQSNGRYTLHESLPKICARISITSVSQIPYLIECLDREMVLQELIESYGYDYDHVPMFDSEQHYIKGENSVYVDPYDVACHIIQNVEYLYKRNNDLAYYNAKKVVDRLECTNLVVTGIVNDEKVSLSGLTLDIVRNNMSQVRRATLKAILGKRSIHVAIKQAQSRFESCSTINSSNELLEETKLPMKEEETRQSKRKRRKFSQY
jgi:hypothetical protein